MFLRPQTPSSYTAQRSVIPRGSFHTPEFVIVCAFSYSRCFPGSGLRTVSSVALGKAGRSRLERRGGLREEEEGGCVRECVNVCALEGRTVRECLRKSGRETPHGSTLTSILLSFFPSSGGLLICLPREQAARFCAEIKSPKYGEGHQAWIIGIVEKGNRTARIIDKPRIIEVAPQVATQNVNPTPGATS